MESHSFYLGNRADGSTRLGGAETGKTIDEEVLVRNILAVNPKEGCELLFRKYYSILCSHAVRFVHSREIAEDIVSDLFCKLWSEQIYLAINSSFRAYLFKAVRFNCYTYIRWELSKQRSEVGIDTINIPAPSLLSEEALLLEELGDEIDRIINSLPSQCKKVFMLSRFEGKKYQEIADELGISIKAVEAHVSRALQILRSKLKRLDLLSLFIMLLLKI